MLRFIAGFYEVELRNLKLIDFRISIDIDPIDSRGCNTKPYRLIPAFFLRFESGLKTMPHILRIGDPLSQWKGQRHRL